MKRIFIVIVAVLSVGFGKSSFSQCIEDTLKVLFVGNSYTNSNNLTQIISFISDQAEKKLLTNQVIIGGPKPYLYVTWAREKVPQYQETINQVYTDVARTNKAVIVPVGKTWERAKQLRPTIGLYSTDGSHPSVLATSLTACVFSAAILCEVPEKLPSVLETIGKDGKSTVSIEVDSLDVIFCQKVASEVVLGWQHL